MQVYMLVRIHSTTENKPRIKTAWGRVGIPTILEDTHRWDRGTLNVPLSGHQLELYAGIPKSTSTLIEVLQCNSHWHRLLDAMKLDMGYKHRQIMDDGRLKVDLSWVPDTVTPKESYGIITADSNHFSWKIRTVDVNFMNGA